MIAYILKVTMCWLFFYGVYELFLKQRTFFNANRSYLLITLITGLLLPLLEFIPWRNETNVGYVIYPMLLEIDDLQAVVSSKRAARFSWIDFLYLVYVIGFSLSLLRFSLGFRKIFQLFRRSEKIKKSGYIMVLTKESHLPFSFFKWVFFSKKTVLNNEVDRILVHEIEHIKGRHSFDVLFTELLKVFFWCSPLIYLYRKALKEVHEFLADHIVVRKTDKLSYKKLLLEQNYDGLQLALTHQFFNSHLKNRLKMINQKRSGRPTLVMYALGIPVLLLLLLAFTFSYQDVDPSLEPLVHEASVSEQNERMVTKDRNTKIVPLKDQFPKKGDDPTKTIAERIASRFIAKKDTVPPAVKDLDLEKTEVLKVAEQMPRFPGCEEINGSDKEKERCSQQKMLEYIFKNLKYPEELIKSGKEGITVVQFIVNKNGDISNPRIARSLAKSADEEVLRVVASMNIMAQKWIPGRQGGTEVAVQYTLPVKFKLNEKEDASVVKKEKGNDIDLGNVGEEPIYFLDGKKIDKAEFIEIDPNLIASINVFKGNKAIEKYGEEGKDGVVSITLKSLTEIETEAMADFDTPAYFPGCSEFSDPDQKSACSNKMLKGYIISNFEYPKTAEEKGIEGKVLSRFLINKEGKMEQIGLKKEVNGLNESAIDFINKMAGEIQWEPAKKDGKPVAMEMVIPINYELAQHKKVENHYTSCEQIEDRAEREKCMQDGQRVLKENLTALNLATQDLGALVLTNFKVFPNPAKESINIKFRSDEKPIKIQLFTIDGKSVYVKNINDFKGVFDEIVNLSEVTATFLILNIEQEGLIYREKIFLH